MWMEGAFFFTLVMLIELRVFRSLRLRIVAMFTPGNAASYTVNVPAEVRFKNILFAINDCTYSLKILPFCIKTSFHPGY